MPWANNAALPDSVKTLPEGAQSIFRAAANSALQDGKAEEVAMQTGWGAVKNAGWKKDDSGVWVKENSEPETNSMDMEVFASGTWNGDKFSDADCEDIVRNFNELRDAVKPFLKLGGVNPHTDLVHQPAIGWVESLRFTDGRIIASVKDIPRIVFEAIKRKLYRRVSSEIYQGYKQGEKVYNYVLRAVALLGASVPAVSTLKDLTTYLSEQNEGVAVLSFSELKIFKEETKMADVDVKMYEDKIAAEAAARKVAEDKAAASEAELKNFKEEQVKVLRTGKETEVKAFCEQAVKDGKMPPFVRDAIFPKDSPVLVFAEDHSVLLPFEVMKSFVEKVKVIDFEEMGADDKKKETGNPGEILDQRAAALVASKAVSTYSEAVQKVLREDPELAAAYSKDSGKKVN